MEIAITVADGKLSMHFGHCERFALVDVDPVHKKIGKREDLDAPRMSRDFCRSGWRKGEPR